MTLLFKIHYFLWYGGITSIMSYESVYARYYTNATTVQFGTLRMILPFLAVGVTPIVCLNADRRRKHRLYFTVSLILAAFSLMAYSLLPLTMLIDEYESTVAFSNSTSEKRTVTHRNYYWIGDKSQPLEPATNADPLEQKALWVGPFIYFCLVSMLFELSLAVNICLSDSYAVLQAEESGTTFGRIIVWGTFGWAFSALIYSIINQQAIIARLLPGLLFGVSCLSIDSVLVSLWSRDEDFKLDFISLEAAQSLTGSSSSGHREPTDYMPMNEANLINMGTEVNSKSKHLRRRMKLRRSSEISLDRGENGQMGPMRIMNHLHVADAAATPRSPIDSRSPSSASPRSPLQLHSMSPISISPRSPLNEDPRSSTMSSAIKTINSDYIGPSSAHTHPTEEKPEEENLDPYSQKTTAKSPLEAIIDLSKLMRPIEIDKDGVALHETAVDDDNKKPPLTATLKIQLFLFYLILKRRSSLIRYLIMFIFSGVFMSMQWNYFFLFLEDTYKSDFEHISALSMVAQAVLGELPFFILSRRIINLFGRSHTISLSMICIGLRFLLYRFLLRPDTCMYFVFLADALQGPTYGLFYVVMTEVGLEYSYCDDSTVEQLMKMDVPNKANMAHVDAIRLALRSTIQSIAFACYEGLGVGFGSLLGGIILQNYNFDALWFWLAMSAVTIGLVNSSIEILCREGDLTSVDSRGSNERQPPDDMQIRALEVTPQIFSNEQTSNKEPQV